MRGLWGKFWARSVVTLAVVLPAAFIAAFFPICVVWSAGLLGSWGVIDFAGGSVIRVNFLGLAAAIFPYWLAAEIVAWRCHKPLLFGHYFIFILAFDAALVALTNGIGSFIRASGVFSGLIEDWFLAGFFAVLVTAFYGWVLGRKHRNG